MRLIISILTCFILYVSTILAQNAPQARFTENKGQWDSRIEYSLQMHAGDIWFEHGQFTFLLSEKPQDEHEEGGIIPQILKSHLYRSKFLGVNPLHRIVSDNRYSDYRNYYLGNDPKRWADHVYSYSSVTYKDLYSGIDVHVYDKNDHLKYDYWVSPAALQHGGLSQIQVAYEGIEKGDISLNSTGDLVLKTNVGEVKELKPYAYQVIDGKEKEVGCEYHLENRILSFRLNEAEIDMNKPLVIDPTLIFSTFTGSTQDNKGFTSTYDDLGNAFVGGTIVNGTFGSTGYPTDSGAFQTFYQGGSTDAAITKFNPTGDSLRFSTYLGGNLADLPASIVADAAGNLFVLGRTTSTNFPTTPGTYDPTDNGDIDLFLIKFDPTGILLAGTYIGGSGQDGVNGDTISGVTTSPSPLEYNYGDDARGDVFVDDIGNVYVASCTKSNDFPMVNPYQAAFAGGLTDGVVFKMNNSLSSLIFSTYLGGSDIDAAYSVNVDNAYNVYTSGGTTSSNFPTSATALNSTYQGGSADGFISKLNPAGNTLLASTYLGTNDYDQNYFLQLENNIAVYVYGQSNGNYPVVGAVYTNAGANQYITKLNTNLSSILLSTTFGTSDSLPNLVPSAFLVDVCGSVYAGGWGGPGSNPNNALTNGMPTTSNAIDTTTDGRDYYFLVLSPGMTILQYATFFGGSTVGEHIHGGTSRFDPSGVVYQAVCAGCGGSDDFPTGPGTVWSTTNGSNACNIAMFKMDFDFQLVTAVFTPTENNIPTYDGCVPLTLDMQNNSTSAPGTTYTWYFGDGDSSNLYQPTHTYTYADTFNVALIINSATCGSDTTFSTIIVYPSPSANSAMTDTSCVGTVVSLSYSGDPAVTYTWDFAGGTVLSGSGGGPYSLSWSSSGVYCLDISITDSNGCKSDTTTNCITILDLPTSDFTLPDTACFAYTAIATYTGTAGVGAYYTWNFFGGNATPGGTGQGPDTISWASSGYHSVSLVVTEYGCTSPPTTHNVYLEAGPIASFAMADSICENDTVVVTGVSYAGATYFWDFGGASGGGAGSGPFNLSWVGAGIHTVKLYIESANGCPSDTFEKDILINPSPSSAFTVTDTLCITDTAFVFYTGGSPANATYNWNFGGGTILSGGGQGPYTLSFNTATDYYLSLVVIEKGCSSLPTNDTVTVAPLPVASFTMADSICENETVLVSIIGAPYPGATYYWDFGGATGGGAGSGPFNLSWVGAGVHTVKLYIESALGCASDTFVKDILINPSPSSAFTATDTICITSTSTVTYTGTSPSTATYNWNFAGGTILAGSGQGPYTLSFSGASDYYLSLIVVEKGCASLPSYDTVTVSALPESDFVMNDTACINAAQSINYIGQNIPNQTYNWNFGTATVLAGSGQGPYAVSWSVPNTQTVTLTTSTPACPVSFTSLNIMIIQPPTANISAAPNIICSMDSAMIISNNNSPNYTYLWNFDGGIATPGGGQGPHSVNWSSVGIKYITLTLYDSGCPGTSDTAIVDVYQPPTANFSYPNFVCIFDTNQVVFTGQAAVNAYYYWDFGDAIVISGTGQGPYVLSWNTPGVKTICVSVSQPACPPTDTICHSFTIIDKPVSSIAPISSVCFPDSIFSFIFNGTPGVNDYYWGFPGGVPSFVVNNPSPSGITYSSPGHYDVWCYVVKDGCGSDTAWASFDILPKPDADFTYSGPPCMGACVDFIYTGTALSNQQSYSWTFGATSSPVNSTLPNVGCVQFNSPVLTPVTLVVEHFGCTDTNTISVPVALSPLVNAGVDTFFCDGTGPITLNGSVINGTLPYLYTWSSIPVMGGISNPYVEDPMVNPAGDTYYIIYVEDGNGCGSNTDTVFVSIRPRPTAYAGPDQRICQSPTTLGVFLQGSVGPNNQAPGSFSYSWFPNTGMNPGQDTLLNPYVFPTITTIYTLVITSSNGCSSDPLDTMSTVTVDVTPLPIVDAGPTIEMCLGDTVQFNAFAGGGGNYTYTWTPYSGTANVFDPFDPLSLASPTLTHTYTLVVVGDYGCIGSDTVSIIVHTLPTASIFPGTAYFCQGDSVLLIGNASGDITGTLYTYSWSPGAGLSDSTAAQTWAHPDTTMQYTLYVGTSFCKGFADSMTVHIKPTPWAVIANQDTIICSGTSVQLFGSFNFNGSPIAGPVIFDWQPANSLDDNTIPNPIATPTQSTLYTLTTSSVGDCPTIDSVLIVVNPMPIALATADNPVMCAGDTNVLHALGGVGAAFYSWTPAFSLNDSTIQNPVASPDTSTTYYVWINEANCIDSASIYIAVNPRPMVDYGASNMQGCAPLTVAFGDASIDALSYIWNFGDGSPVINEPTVFHTYTQPGIYPIIYTVAGIGGCIAVDSSGVIEVSNPVFANFVSNPAPNIDMYLPLTEVHFTDLSTQGSAWYWSFGDGQSSTDKNPTHLYEVAGEYTVTLIVTNNVGCTDSISRYPYRVLSPDLFIPNIFSPNGDGLYDEWIVQYMGSSPFSVEVFDRWGVIYFFADSPKKTWDGRTIYGTEASDGMYFYSIKVGEKVFTGNVTLMR